MSSLEYTPEVSPFNFKCNHNTITFNDHISGSLHHNQEETPNSCCISISVEIKPMKIGKKIDYWYFDVSYSHTTKGKGGIYMHPLYRKTEEEGDSTLFEGIMLAANPITFHMLEILLSKENNNENFNTGSRPFQDYQGEIMRALTEFEN